MALLSVAEHRELFSNAGYSDVRMIEKRDKGWICGIGRKPIANSSRRTLFYPRWALNASDISTSVDRPG
jgi:hypothetical protein